MALGFQVQELQFEQPLVEIAPPESEIIPPTQESHNTWKFFILSLQKPIYTDSSVPCFLPFAEARIPSKNVAPDMGPEPEPLGV